MENNTLVSIIVPCYNVELFVEKCIRSIMVQSYSNIEILAINDGSSDDTPKLLECLSNEDNRVKVIHKQNEGVSTARNYGLKIATGQYVVFVDGDDYLATDYIAYMLRLAVISDSDFCLSQNCFTKDKEIQVASDDIKILTCREITALLISPRIIVGCWNKMFKREFINKFRLSFSTTLFYGEGLNFIIKAAQLANNVVVGNRKVYYYRRNNEASATSKFNIQKYYNGEKALDKIQSELIVCDKNIDLMMALHKSLFCLGALSQVYVHKLQEVHKNDCKHWHSVVKSNLRNILITRQISLYRKILLIVGYISPRFMSKLDTWRRTRIAKQSVN